MPKVYKQIIADLGEPTSKIRAETPGTMDGFDAMAKATMAADALRAHEEFGGPAA